jgi:hypothetical protein
VKGFQIYLPLSPIHLLVFFDSGVYCIGKNTERVVDKISEYDVNAINYLQYVNAYYNLYFNELAAMEYVISILEKMNKYRRDRKTFTNIYNMETVPNDSARSILHTYRNDVKIKLNLSFVRITSKAKRYKLGNKAVHMRNEELAIIYGKFVEAVHRQEYRFDQWDEFFRNWMSRYMAH